MSPLMSILLQEAAGGLIATFLGYHAALRGTVTAGLSFGRLVLLLVVGCVGTAVVLVLTELLLVSISPSFSIQSSALLAAILLSGGVAKLWRVRWLRRGEETFGKK